MNFFKAMESVARGEKVTRKEWNNREVFGVLHQGRLMIKGGEKQDGAYHPWIINDGDMLADDWEVQTNA